MLFSLNCLFLGEASIRSISVIISEEIIVDNNKIQYEEITVSNVKSLILSQKKISYSLDQLNLWKVDRDSVNKNDNVLETFSTEDDIKETLGGKLMNPRHSLSDFFNENSFKDKKSKYDIHIIVSITAHKLLENLEFRDPHPLLLSSGSSWDFQASDSLKKILKNAIQDHFKFWKAGQIDKTKIPQYFILAGAGEGKSRTAQELPKLLMECTNDVNLQNRLKSALVFNLSFENGTKLIRGSETDSSIAIGNRMLFQLLRQSNESWDDFQTRYRVRPAEVLRSIAKHRGQEFSDLNVIIILDGLQVAMNNLDEGKNKNLNHFFL